MKHSITLFLLFCLASQPVFAQANSPAYELQRKKINGLLDARSAKFGQFEESLSKHTGIFGLKTKKDMQRSIDILSEVMRTDNTILRETKVLLDFKNLETTVVKSEADDSGIRIKGYMAAIKTLQQQNDVLLLEMKQMEQQKSRYNLALAALVAMMLVLFVWARKKER